MAKKRTWTDDQLKLAVKNNESIYGVLNTIGLKLGGGSHALVKLRIKKLEIDTSHFTGQGWCIGDKHQKFIDRNIKLKLDKILVKNSTYKSTDCLRRRLLKENILSNKCYECGMKNCWNEKPITLQLDHIDGDRCNNTIENLRILCPNCHSQTSTFAGRNAKKSKKRKTPKIIKFKVCSTCNKQFSSKHKYCSKQCSIKRKVEIRPEYKELISLVEEHGYCKTGRMFGVSDNTIRKWLKIKPAS